MHDTGKDSSAKLEWNSSSDPFIFGSFGLISTVFAHKGRSNSRNELSEEFEGIWKGESVDFLRNRRFQKQNENELECFTSPAVSQNGRKGPVAVVLWELLEGRDDLDDGDVNSFGFFYGTSSKHALTRSIKHC
ncbi:hypothetical protein SESBI_10238 [Sesbania bispinosa]|nr:hypothetical protein SESBI_10238 [Sesbania bispinosa]